MNQNGPNVNMMHVRHIERRTGKTSKEVDAETGVMCPQAKESRDEAWNLFSS